MQDTRIAEKPDSRGAQTPAPARSDGPDIAPLPTFSVVTWNIHRGRGEDGIVDPTRIVDVMAKEVLARSADLLVLQEADEERRPHRGVLDLAEIQARTGLHHLQAAHSARWGIDSHGFLGVVLFGRAGVDVDDITLLDLPGHCHRGAVVADLSMDGAPLRVVAAHLSLSYILRIAQMRIIGQHLYRRPPRPVLLCGDLNEWRPWSGLAFSPSVLGVRFRGPVRATFPVKRPVFPLDRVLAARGAQVLQTEVLDGDGIRIASDHRPLRAEFALPAQT